MIFKETFVYVGDNAGAEIVRVIHLYGGFKKKSSTISNYVLIAVQNRRVQRQFITKNIYLALIVTIKKNFYRLNGSYIKFNYNKVVLLNEVKKFIGTRIIGPVAAEVLKMKLEKLRSLTKKIC
jgi:large subunit ribosomal protein L14